MKNPINVQHIKNYFRSPLVLVMGILSLLPIILGVLSTSALNDLLIAFTAEVVRILENSGTSTDYISSSSFSVSSVSLTAIAAIAGWLLIYFLAKTKNPSTTPAAGFIIFTILSILGIIVASFLLLISMFFILFGVGLTGNNGTETKLISQSDLKTMGIIIILFGIFLIIFCIFKLITEISRLKFFGAARKSMSNSFLIISGKGFGVLSIITAVFVFLGAISSFLLIGFSNALFDKIPEIHYGNFSKYLNTLYVYTGISALISGVLYCIQAKIALGYCSLAKSTPAQPMNTPYGGGSFGFYGQDNYPQSGYNNSPDSYGEPTPNVAPSENPYGQSSANPASNNPYGDSYENSNQTNI